MRHCANQNGKDLGKCMWTRGLRARLLKYTVSKLAEQNRIHSAINTRSDPYFNHNNCLSCPSSCIVKGEYTM